MKQDFQKLLYKTMPNQNAKAIICGVSGGADSMVLLHELVRYAQSENIQIVAAHVNHGIRGEEALRDEQFVREYCIKNRICFESTYIDIPSIAKENHQSIEVTARVQRRAFLESIATKYETNIIALGHHANDQVETVLLNMVRGTGLKGLVGMNAFSQPYWRPFLEVTRVDIEEFARQNHIEFITDSTNISNEYTRNRMRSLIATLEMENQSFVPNIYSMTQRLNQDETYLQKKAKRYFDDLFDSQKKQLQISNMSEIDIALKIRVLRMFLTEIGFITDIEQRHVDILLQAVDKQQNCVLDFPHQTRLEIEYGYLFKKTDRQICIEKRESYRFTIGELITPWGMFESVETMYQQAEIVKEDKNCIYMPKKYFYNAIVRARKTGDFFVPFGMQGHKQLKKAYIDWKVPKIQRQGPLIAVNDESNEILWIVGYGVSQKATCQEGEECIKMVFWAPK